MPSRTSQRISGLLGMMAGEAGMGRICVGPRAQAAPGRNAARPERAVLRLRGVTR